MRRLAAVPLEEGEGAHAGDSQSRASRVPEHTRRVVLAAEKSREHKSPVGKITRASEASVRATNGDTSAVAQSL